MAGIGFELKKLYKNKSLLGDFRALLYTSAVTIGPQLLCILMITVLQFVIGFLNIAYTEKELFLYSVLYSFVFSQLLTSIFSMVVTRYISDKLYIKAYNKILPSLYGVISICLVIGGVVGAAFLVRSPINIYMKLSTYILFMELIIMWLETVYLSVLKDFVKIVKAFLLGVLSAIALSILMLIKTELEPSLAIVISIDVGIFVIITLLMYYIKSFFKTPVKWCFEFLKCFDKYYSLIFISFFYTLSLYIHNFIYWNSNLGRAIFNTYVSAPIYDVPTFYAFLTILPASIIFVISTETSFYNRYREYYSKINMGGTLKDIKNAKKSMIVVLWRELFHLMEIQFFFSVFFVVLGNCSLPYIGLSETSVYTFIILSFGAYCSISMFIIVLIELYFENRKGALIVTTTFLFSNILFTLISLKFGENYYGFGFFASAFISLVIAILSLEKFLKNIDYITFCSQPIVYREKKGVFTHLVERIYR